MKLYYSPGTCAFAADILLREAKLPFTLVPVDLATKKLPDGSDYRALNPNGYVPTLEIAPGDILMEAPVILQYIADRVPHTRLAPLNGTRERYHLQQWLNFITAELHKSYGPLFSRETPEAYKEMARDKIHTRLGVVEKQLGKTSFIAGDDFTAADAYLFVITGWSPYTGVDLVPFPNLLAWRERVAARASVQDAMKAEGLVKAA